jgi:hypothetical protein
MSLISSRSLSLLLKTLRVLLLLNLKVILYSPAKCLTLISIPLASVPLTSKVLRGTLLIIKVLISIPLVSILLTSRVISTPLKVIIKTFKKINLNFNLSFNNKT